MILVFLSIIYIRFQTKLRSILDSKENNGKRNAVSVQADDVSENAPELKGDSGQGLVTTVWVIHTGDRLVENNLTVPSITGGFLDNFSVP